MTTLLNYVVAPQEENRGINAEKPICIYVPETFHGAVIFDEPYLVEAAGYLLHAIETRRIFHKVQEPFVPLKAEYLRTILGKGDAELVRDQLEAEGIIEIDHHYIVGERSMGYRLAEKFQDVPYRRMELSQPRLIKAIRRWRRRKYLDTLLPVHLHLREWMEHFDFDYLEAAKMAVCKEHVLHCLKMRDKDYHFEVDKYGRVHHNITNMPKCLRKFLSYQGQRLYNVDIANSQPYFLGLLLFNYFLNNEKLVSVRSFKGVESFTYSPRNQATNEQEKGGEEGRHSHYDGNLPYQVDTIRLMESLELVGSLTFPEDVKRYCDIVCRGQLYEKFMSDNKTRDETKHQVFTFVFGKCYPDQNFHREFPNVWNFMRQIKAKDYRHMAHLLQQTESSFMIDRMVGRLMREYPEVPLATIHDSYLTTEPQLVIGVLQEEFSKLGLVPQLRLEEA